MKIIFGRLKDGSLLVFNLDPYQIGRTPMFCSIGRYKASRHIKMPSAVAAITGLVNMEEPILLDGAIFPNKKPKKFHLLQTSFSLPENFIPMVDDNVVNVVKKISTIPRRKAFG
jgi:hypothetical protein